MAISDTLIRQLEDLHAIGIALSAEHNHQRLLEMIVISAKRLTNADAGTLYIVTPDNTLHFEIMRTSSLGIAMGGTTGNPIPFQPLPLYLDDGRPNHHMVAAYAVLNDCTVNIEDAYEAEGFDFSGTSQFDASTGYRSCSFLTVPMKNHEGNIIGVLQLINAKDAATGEITSFSKYSQHLVESLASQAAIALTNHQLIEGLKGLFEAFIRLIAGAIDAKSPYTGDHCRRVPELAMMLADAVNRTESGPLKDFYMDEEELDELRIAAWIHDCGKVAIPDSLMDKPTKLSTLFDRIVLLEQRFALLKKQMECRLLRQQLQAVRQGQAQDEALLAQEHADSVRRLDEDLNFLRQVNMGSESMSEEEQERVRAIAQYRLEDPQGNETSFLSEEEVYNLTIKSGTLTPEERQMVNHHIVVTIEMLESLPYPPGLRRIPEYAGGHHERMDGRGYPRGLRREQLSIPARMMGIVDIFEALTSADRPYKKAKTLSETLQILGNMKLNQHIDPDLFDVFIREKVYLQYAHLYLQPEQIDEVDETKVPGYQP